MAVDDKHSNVNGMDRENILTWLAEPLALIPADVVARAKDLARTDVEIREAVASCEMLATLGSSEVFGDSTVSDPMFLVELRRRIELPESSSRVFLRPAYAALASGLCAFMVIMIVFGGGILSHMPTRWEYTNSLLVSDDNLAQLEPVDSLTSLSVDPLELAQYLGVDSLIATAGESIGADGDDLITDELLAMDAISREAVLEQLERTSFF